MCGHCELGLDVWRDDPLFMLQFRLEGMDGWLQTHVQWRQSEIGLETLDDILIYWAERTQESLGSFGPEYRAVQADNGYWSDT